MQKTRKNHTGGTETLKDDIGDDTGAEVEAGNGDATDHLAGGMITTVVGREMIGVIATTDTRGIVALTVVVVVEAGHLGEEMTLITAVQRMNDTIGDAEVIVEIGTAVRA